MSDTLEVFGVEYTGVTGIKATDDNGQIKTYIRPQGTKSISANGTGIDVTEYAAVDVAVAASSNDFVVNISWNSTTSKWEPDCTYAEIESAYLDGKNIAIEGPARLAVGCAFIYGGDPNYFQYFVRELQYHDQRDWIKSTEWIYVSAGLFLNGTTETVLPSGTYSVSSAGTADVSIYENVSVPAGSVTAPSSISGTSASVSTGTNTLTLSKTVSVTPSVTTAGYVSSGTAGNSSVSLTASVNTRSSSDLTASGATVTAPAGYYASSASKSVASGSATVNASLNLSSDMSVEVSNQTGMVYASVSGTKSVTPTVSAGYVSSGTAGEVAVTGSISHQLTTQAAQTIHPSTSDQTIASGRYLTGTQTIKAVTTTNLTAGNIANGVVVKIGDSTDDDCVTSVTGSLAFQTYYTGSGTPSSSLGVNGDIYLKTS